MATSIDDFLDTPDKIDTFLDIPTRSSKPTPTYSKKALYRGVTEDQSMFENLLTGAGATVEGWKLRYRQLFGKPPTDAEIQDYRDAVAGLSDSAAPVGMLLPNLLPGAAGMRAATAIPAVANAISAGGVGATGTISGLSGMFGAAQEAATVPVKSDESALANSAKVGAFSAAVPLVAGGATKLAQKTVNAISPYFSQSARQNAGGGLLNKVVGDKTPEVINALRNSRPLISPQNSGQAAVSAQSPEFSTIADIVNKMNPVPGLATTTVAKQGRQAMLGSFAQTPAALDASVAARKVADNAAYANANDIARNARIVADTTLAPPRPVTSNWGGPTSVRLGDYTVAPPNQAIQNISKNPIIDAAKSDASALARNGTELPPEFSRLDPAILLDIAKDPTRSLEGLHLMKVAIDNRFKNPTVETALSKFKDSEVGGAKKAFLSVLPKEYNAAREASAKAAQAIGQMQIGQKAQSILGGTLGDGEKATALAGAVKRETPLVKAAEGSTSKELSQILNPQNEAKLHLVVDELNIDQQFNDLAKAGRQSAAVQKAVSGTIELPHFLNQGVILANTAIRRFFGGGQTRTFKELATILQDPVRTAKIMEQASIKERNAIKFLIASQTTTGAVAPAAVQGLTQ